MPNSKTTILVVSKQCGRDSKEPNGRPLKIFTRMGNGIFARENVNSGFDLVRFISAAKNPGRKIIAVPDDNWSDTLENSSSSFANAIHRIFT